MWNKNRFATLSSACKRSMWWFIFGIELCVFTLIRVLSPSFIACFQSLTFAVGWLIVIAVPIAVTDIGVGSMRLWAQQFISLFFLTSHYFAWRASASVFSCSWAIILAYYGDQQWSNMCVIRHCLFKLTLHPPLSVTLIFLFFQKQLIIFKLEYIPVFGKTIDQSKKKTYMQTREWHKERYLMRLSDNAYEFDRVWAEHTQ